MNEIVPRDRLLHDRLLRDCLPLLTTYAWKGKTPLTPTPVGADGDLSIGDFLREFRMRHAMACADRLVAVVSQIEARASHTSQLVRSESRGEIRGRLDVQRYVARGPNRASYPRRYPIVQNQRSGQTPENELVASALREVVAALRDNPFQSRANESALATRLMAWARTRQYRRPWEDIVTTRGSERLRTEVQTRVRRRQTGNDSAYQGLLDWYDEWTVDLHRLGEGRANNLVEGLLALPTGESFWNRAFEIWCLELTMEALVDLGWDREMGPLPLHLAGGLIATYRTPSGELVDVRFQQQWPLPTGRWRYRKGDPLRGIPDVSLSVLGYTPVLFIDAKFRWIEGTDSLSRSEETYKMLGYAENFAADATHFRGVLIFPSNVSLHRVLDGPNAGRIDLASVALLAERERALSGFRDAIRSWLASISPQSGHA